MKNQTIQPKMQVKLFHLVMAMVLLTGFLALVWFGKKQTAYGKEAVSSPAELTAFAMNTVITMEAYGGDAVQGIHAAKERLTELEKLWSVTDEESEVWKINHSQGKPAAVSSETEHLLSFALRMAEETGGSLNPAVYPMVRAWGFTTGNYEIPDAEKLQELVSHTDISRISLSDGSVSIPEEMELDFGAVAKGYTGDRMAEILKEHGVTSAIINIGGNVRLIGGTPEGEHWKVGIRSPYGEGNMGVLEAQDVNIITSGGYERYFIGEDGNQYWHILDPRTGYPADSGIISATIVGADGALCDALSTAAFVMGLEKAEEYWRSRDGFEMILVTDDNEIYLTEGLEDSFTLTEMSQGIPVHVVRR